MKDRNGSDMAPFLSPENLKSGKIIPNLKKRL